ncbi:serine/arginine repetitive matrix protein 1-like [Saccostrea cucullata]|uniref:serine/arginine repetitive matrix protein 1-like n=1 Tax=Saccostrea cuccullata TaxID=36930 RepID=UPI002ED211FB
MPDPTEPLRGPVYGTGPDYRVHQPAFYSYTPKTYDRVHHYNKAHEPLRVHTYDSYHTYDKIRTYNDVQEYKVKEYKPNFYTAPKPPPRVPTPLPTVKRRPKTPDYQWAQLYVCYEEPLGPHIPVTEYENHEYRGREYKPIVNEYRPLKIDNLSKRPVLYQGNVEYKLTKENYYPFRKRKDIQKIEQPAKKQKVTKQKEKSVASLKEVKLKEDDNNAEHFEEGEEKINPVQQRKSPEILPEALPIRDDTPPHPLPVVSEQEREKTPEKEKTFINEAERNGIAVGTTVLMVSAATGTDDLKRKKRCSRWTQTTPVSSPEPSIREMTPVEIVPKTVIVGVPNKRAETPLKPLKQSTPEPLPQPEEKPEPEHIQKDPQLPPYNVVAPAAVVVDYKRRRTPTPPSRRSRRKSSSPRAKSRTPSPKSRSPSPRRYYRNSPGILPMAGFAAGAVVSGTVVAPLKKRTPTPDPPLPHTKNKTPSPKPESTKPDGIPAAAVVVSGTVIHDNKSNQDNVKSPSPSSPDKKSPSPVNRSPTPAQKSPDINVVPIIPLAAASLDKEPTPNPSPKPPKEKTPSPSTPRDDRDNAPIVPLAVSKDDQPNQPSPVKSQTPSPSPSVSLQSLGKERTSSPSPTPSEVVPVAAVTTTVLPKEDKKYVSDNPVSNPPVSPVSPKREASPTPPKVSTPTEDASTENDGTSAGGSRRGLPPEVIAALEAYDSAHKNGFDKQVAESNLTFALSASRSPNLPPEVLVSIEAYVKMRRR